MFWKNRLCCGLAWSAPGLSFGIGLMLILGQWTWLELRWNTGQSWWIVTMIFLAEGLLSGSSPKLPWLLAGDGLLLFLFVILVFQGRALVFPAALFREGLAWTISLEIANLILVSMLLLVHLFPALSWWRQKRSF